MTISEKILRFFKLKRIKTKPINHSFTDEDRAAAAQVNRKRGELTIRKLDLEIKKLEKEEQKLNTMNMEELFVSVAQNMLMGGLSNMQGRNLPPSGSSAPAPFSKYEQLTEEDIKAYLQNMPPEGVRFLKSKTPEQLRELAEKHKDQLPFSGEQNLEMAIKVIQGWPQ